MLQETVVTTALRLNFEFTPTHQKNGRVSEEAQPTSNQKTIVLQKEFSLIGADCHHPTPTFRLDYISYIGSRPQIHFKKEERNINQSNPCDSSLFIIVETHKFASLLSNTRTLQRNPNCRVIRIVTLFICVGAVTAPCCLRMRGNSSRASNGELLPSAWSRCAPASLRCCHPSPYEWQGAFISFLR